MNLFFLQICILQKIPYSFRSVCLLLSIDSVAENKHHAKFNGNWHNVKRPYPCFYRFLETYLFVIINILFVYQHSTLRYSSPALHMHFGGFRYLRKFTCLRGFSAHGSDLHFRHLQFSLITGLDTYAHLFLVRCTECHMDTIKNDSDNIFFEYKQTHSIQYGAGKRTHYSLKHKIQCVSNNSYVYK